MEHFKEEVAKLFRFQIAYNLIVIPLTPYPGVIDNAIGMLREYTDAKFTYDTVEHGDTIYLILKETN